MTYDIRSLPLIYLGRQGENLARTVEIDVGAMLEAYPGASIGLVFQRAGETELYIGATTLGGTVLSWPISAAVTANAGRGKIEVRAMLGDVLAKSVTARGQAERSQCSGLCAEGRAGRGGRERCRCGCGSRKD